jgi:hypothetical protein
VVDYFRDWTTRVDKHRAKPEVVGIHVRMPGQHSLELVLGRTFRLGADAPFFIDAETSRLLTCAAPTWFYSH